MRSHISPLPFLLLAMLATVSGCTHRTGQSWGSGSEGVSRSSMDKAVDFSIEYLKHNGHNYLVLAVEGCMKSSVSSGPETKGQLFTTNNRQIDWSCSTSDDKNGIVLIDGQDFDLAKGALFVVSITGDKTNAEQLSVDMTKLQGGNVTIKLQALEKSESRLAEFWKRVGKIE